MPIPSPYPDVTIPQIPLYDAIFGDLSGGLANKTALIDGLTGEEMTFQELKASYERMAGALAARGVGKGDVVALHCPNHAAFVISYFGILRSGATVTTLGSLATAEDAEKQLRAADAKMLLTTDLLGTAGMEAAQAKGIPAEGVINLTDAEAGLKALLAENHTAPEVEINADEDIAVLPFSSGTTGIPKGVKLSHQNLVANLFQVSPSMQHNGMKTGSVVCGVLPFFHIYGMNCLLGAALFQGCTMVTLPKFELESFLSAHERFNIDCTFIAPPIAVLLAKHPAVESYDLSSLRAIQSGAAPLDRELAIAVQQRLGVDIYQGFGMTETSPVTHNSLVNVTPLESVGAPLPNTEIKIVDISKDDLPEIPAPTQSGERSAVGEMWVRGPQVMKGYLNNEEATARTLLPDGWLRTGDMVAVDSEGNCYVVDRAKELIKYKGYQVPPAELEALLLTRDDISDAAVVGYVREEDGEEIPRAFVVPQQNSAGVPAEIDPEELKAWVAERVAPYKKVRIVEFVDAVPKSATGKILRKDLKNRPLDAQLVSAPQ